MPTAVSFDSGLDLDRLRGRISDWNVACGERVRARRLAIGIHGHQLAGLVGCTVQTISKVERGEIVPRDYLKAALSVALCVEVEELWPWPTRASLTRDAH